MKFALLALALAGSVAQANDFSIQDYNNQLPVWGVSWQGGNRPSFYTGFAVRQQAPERIMIKTARGNQTRVTVILDSQALTDYTYDLAKRYEFYKRANKLIG